MTRITLFLFLLCLVSSCAGVGVDMNLQKKTRAQRYFRAVYECKPLVINELAAEDIVISYPIFKQIFGKPALHGLKEVKAFSARFCSRWLDTKLTINEAVVGPDKVVLVWTFSARDSQAKEKESAKWGGITLFHFDSEGKISAELGEESAPGPIERLRDAAGHYDSASEPRAIP